jgi:hypothetical protein
MQAIEFALKLLISCSTRPQSDITELGSVVPQGNVGGALCLVSAESFVWFQKGSGSTQHGGDQS